MNIDPRLAQLGVKVDTTPGAKWSLSSAQYQDESQAQGNHIILFTVLDANNKPQANVTCVVDWVGRDPNSDPPTKVVTDATGQGNVPIYANLDITKLNGPYFAYVQDITKSDVVRGMGLPEHHHVNFLLTFAPQAVAPVPPPPPPAQTLEQAAQAAAQKLTWMPININAALYQFAQKNNLGYPQTDEFQFPYNNTAYLGQVFNLGIVYVQVGDWGNVKWVKKP